MTMWWEALPDEHFWIEIRKEHGIGIDLHSPARDKNGNRDSRYDLVSLVRKGDVVFHYNANESRFVGRSIALSDAIVTPDQHRVPLSNFMSIDEEVGLFTIREMADKLYSIRDAYHARYDRPYHLPFQFTEDRSELKMMSNYFVRFPREMVRTLFGDETQLLSGPAEISSPEKEPLRRQGGFLTPFKPKRDTAYLARVRESAATRERRHETLVNDCAEWLSALGYEVGRNAAIDLAIVSPSVIIEAKTVGNSWSRPIREAISQLYEYRHFQVVPRTSALVLLAEREPPSDWLDYLEKDRGIGVIWPIDGHYQLSPLARKAIRKFANALPRKDGSRLPEGA